MLFIDIKAGKEYNYTYEGSRLVRSAEHNVTFDEQYNVILRDYVGTIDYTYAKDGRLVKKNVYVYGASVQYFTEYPENSNPIVKVKYNNQSVESHSKTDSFGRKEFEELQAVNEQVTAKSETNLRTLPSVTDSKVVYTLKNGEYVTRTGISTNGWSRLEYNGQTVYAVSSYLTQ